MIELIFLIKLIVAVSVVLILSLIAEYTSPKVAGLISGYPTGTAIILFFFALEISPQFASNRALYNMVGIVAMQSFLYFYYKSSLYFKKFNILLSSLTAIAGYFVAILALHFIKTNKIISTLIATASIFLFFYLFRKIKDVKIEHIMDLKHLNFNTVLFRALLAAAIILAITWVAKFVGPSWAGLFSAFPTTLFPFILIVHSTYSKKHVHTIIKNVPVGLGALIAYSLTISITYPLFGIYIGTLLSFFAAAIYLLSYTSIKNRLQKKELLGVLGGLGPESTIEFYRFLIKLMPVKREQDHLQVLIYSNPKVPDRTASILGKKYRSVLDEEVASCKHLKKAGATRMVVVCNTSHFYLSHLRKRVGLPFISLIEETSNELVRNKARTVLLLATTGTVKSNTYQDVLERTNIKVFLPDKKDQERIMDIVYGVKLKGVNAKHKQALQKIINKFSKKTSHIILGCTELALVMKKVSMRGKHLYDPLKIVATEVIKDTLRKQAKGN